MRAQKILLWWCGVGDCARKSNDRFVLYQRPKRLAVLLPFASKFWSAEKMSHKLPPYLRKLEGYCQKNRRASVAKWVGPSLIVFRWRQFLVWRNCLRWPERGRRKSKSQILQLSSFYRITNSSQLGKDCNHEVLRHSYSCSGPPLRR